MSGIYFIAAGQSSRNREKSLDKSIPCEDVAKLLSSDSRHEFLQHSSTVDAIYAWGAGVNKIKDLNKLAPGDFVVDVKNKKVVQVFQFVCLIETQDTRLQDYIGWDSEKPKDKRRSYRLVYFLEDPKKTTRTEKAFFQSVFAQESNQNWLVGQKWFSLLATKEALELTCSSSIDELLAFCSCVPRHYQ